MSGIKRVAEIISKRDSIPIKQATELVEETAELLNERPWDAEDILADNLGLEMDYIFDLLF